MRSMRTGPGPRRWRRPAWSRYAVVAVALLTIWAVPAGAAIGVQPPTIGGAALDTVGVVVDPGAGAARPPDTEAAAYVVADLATGDVLAAKSAHQRLPPASTLKMLTALTLLPELDKTEVVVGTDEEVLVEGSKVGISAGLSYSVDLLFQAMLVDSGNDAAYALARVGGGLEQTVASMNLVAEELQAFDTTVVNPTGLDAPGQLTSAYDLALIARAALERADFRTYVTMPTAQLPARDGSSYQIQNGNRLLGSYAGLIGVKNGFTTLARHTYVGAAERGGRGFVVTVLRTEGRPELVAAQLLDWAFRYADAVEPVGELVTAGEPIPALSAGPGASAPPTAGAAAEPGAAAAAGATGGGLGTLATAGLVAVGLVGAVAVLRIGALRRDRLRRGQHRLAPDRRV